MLKTVLAQVCRVCPACILRRRLPGSGYAHFMNRIEKNCPFCRAYDDLYGKADRADVRCIDS